MPFTKNTKLTTWSLLPSVIFDQNFHQLKLKDKTINFLSLIPLTNEEVKVKLNKWIETLFDGFNKYWVNDILVINRESTVKKKKIFWLF